MTPVRNEITVSAQENSSLMRHIIHHNLSDIHLKIFMGISMHTFNFIYIKGCSGYNI